MTSGRKKRPGRASLKNVKSMPLGEATSINRGLTPGEILSDGPAAPDFTCSSALAFLDVDTRRWGGSSAGGSFDPQPLPGSEQARTKIASGYHGNNLRRETRLPHRTTHARGSRANAQRESRI